MLFNFRLRPIGHIAPWRHEGQPTLHWFGLTDGWYWMDVGSDELFRYTDDILNFWDRPSVDQQHLPYVDYHVVRFWEDLQEMLPSILEPIPDYILKQVQPDTQIFVWWDRMNTHFRSKPDISEDDYDLFDEATSWLNYRWLDVGYLEAGPRICCWTQGQIVVIHWDNRDVLVNGIPVWTATVGSITLPINAFIDELRSFDQRLIQNMQDRIAAIERHWSSPGIKIDVPALLREQQDRATFMERSLKQAQQHKGQTSWKTVVDALTHWNA